MVEQAGFSDLASHGGLKGDALSLEARLALTARVPSRQAASESPKPRLGARGAREASRPKPSSRGGSPGRKAPAQDIASVRSPPLPAGSELVGRGAAPRQQVEGSWRGRWLALTHAFPPTRGASPAGRRRRGKMPKTSGLDPRHPSRPRSPGSCSALPATGNPPRRRLDTVAPDLGLCRHVPQPPRSPRNLLPSSPRTWWISPTADTAPESGTSPPPGSKWRRSYSFEGRSESRSSILSSIERRRHSAPASLTTAPGRSPTAASRWTCAPSRAVSATSLVTCPGEKPLPPVFTSPARTRPATTPKMSTSSIPPSLKVTSAPGRRWASRSSRRSAAVTSKCGSTPWSLARSTNAFRRYMTASASPSIAYACSLPHPGHRAWAPASAIGSNAESRHLLHLISSPRSAHPSSTSRSRDSTEREPSSPLRRAALR